MAVAQRRFLTLRVIGDRSIRFKVIAAFGVVLAITVGLGLFAVERLGSVNSAAATLAATGCPAWWQPAAWRAAWRGLSAGVGSGTCGHPPTL